MSIGKQHHLCYVCGEPFTWGGRNEATGKFIRIGENGNPHQCSTKAIAKDFVKKTVDIVAESKQELSENLQLSILELHEQRIRELERKIKELEMK